MRIEIRKLFILATLAAGLIAGLTSDGIVGPSTARKIMLTADNARATHGGSKDDCFLGVQRSGNLGTLCIIRLRPNMRVLTV